MIADYGKLAVTLVLIIGLLLIIGFGGADDSVSAWALLGGVTGYVFANGKQLVAPFQPSPMIAPKPDKLAAIAEAENDAR